MPVKRCTDDGKPGFKWGDAGKCYVYDPDDEESKSNARRRATMQGVAIGETKAMTPAELEASRAVAKRVGVDVEKAEGSGLIVCWPVPPDLASQLRLGVEGALEPQDMHMTIVYLGDADDHDVELVAAVTKIFAHARWPINASVGGYGRFATGAEEDVIVALVDSPELDRLRHEIENELQWQGVQLPEADHGFMPHITLAYVPRGTEIPPQPPIIPASGMIATLGCWAGPRRSIAGLDAEYPEEDMEYAAAEAAPVYRSASPQLEYVAKSQNEEKRYTFGPLYAPDRVDAHGDHVDADDLQEAVWGYVRESAAKGRRLNLQHEDSGWSTCAEWVEIVSWPYETTVKLRVPGEEERELVMPANTVYMGVVWDKGVWEDVKAGRIGGLSMGGRAVRVSTDASETPRDHMGDRRTPRG